jgi:hypothetical protein
LSEIFLQCKSFMKEASKNVFSNWFHFFFDEKKFNWKRLRKSVLPLVYLFVKILKKEYRLKKKKFFNHFFLIWATIFKFIERKKGSEFETKKSKKYQRYFGIHFIISFAMIERKNSFSFFFFFEKKYKAKK